MDSLAVTLSKSPKKILKSRDLALLWEETDADRLKSKTAYYVKTGTLRRLTRGVFAKKEEYDRNELAASLYSPSYVSFETVLREAGMIFQHYDTVFLAGPWARKTTVDGVAVVIRKLKDAVVFNPLGVNMKGNYSIATPERAFLDTLYLFPEYHFDNLRGVDWEKCLVLVDLYENKQLVKRLRHYRDTYAE